MTFYPFQISHAFLTLPLFTSRLFQWCFCLVKHWLRVRFTNLCPQLSSLNVRSIANLHIVWLLFFIFHIRILYKNIFKEHILFHWEHVRCYPALCFVLRFATFPTLTRTHRSGANAGATRVNCKILRRSSIKQQSPWSICITTPGFQRCVVCVSCGDVL